MGADRQKKRVRHKREKDLKEKGRKREQECKSWRKKEKKRKKEVGSVEKIERTNYHTLAYSIYSHALIRSASSHTLLHS